MPLHLGLFLVLKGVVSMSQINSDGGDAGGGPTTVEIHRSHGGGCFGQLQVLTDEPSFFTVKVVKPEAPHRETVVAKLEADFIRSHQQRDCVESTFNERKSLYATKAETRTCVWPEIAQRSLSHCDLAFGDAQRHCI